MERKVMYGVVALGLGAFAISYETLFHVATGAGIPFVFALIYGALTEGFISIATLAAVTLRGVARAYAWWVMIMAFGYSLWANAAPQSVPSGIVRSIPVLAVPLAVHLGILMHEAKTKRTAEAATRRVVDAMEAVVAHEAEVEARAAQVAQDAAEVEARAAQVAQDAANIENAEATPIDFSTVSVDDIPEESRELLAAQIMAEVASTPQTRSYWNKKVRELRKPTLTVAVA